MSNGHYILKDKKVIEVDDVVEWAKKFEGSNRRVAETEKNGIRVSTVFLGLDHGWGEGEPLVFETMIFEGEEDGYQERYSTWDEAEAGHEAACKVAGFVKTNKFFKR